jgi:hypothetical protein
LQQVPRDLRFRALFVPESGNVFVVADYSSMELRAAAHISRDRAMTEVFEQGLDLHALTASRMTGKDPAAVTAEERTGAKAVNFGGAYGQGAAGLVQSAWARFDLILDPTEAKEWLLAFERAYYSFAQWRRDHYRRCEDRHHTVIGRDADRGIGRIFPKSHVPEGKSYYTRCCNLPIQGACADASMLALAYIDDRLFEANIDGAPVAWLHDEFVLEVREDQADRAAEILKQSMIDGFTETFPGAPVNGLVDPHIGASWGKAKSGAAQTHVAKEESTSPQPDYARIFRERRELLAPDAGGDQAHARTTIRFAVAATIPASALRKRKSWCWPRSPRRPNDVERLRARASEQTPPPSSTRFGLAARSFPRPLGRAEACSPRDHLFDMDGRQPLAAHGLRRTEGRQAGGRCSAGSRARSIASQHQELHLWADSAPTGAASGKTGVHAIAVIPASVKRALPPRRQKSRRRVTSPPARIEVRSERWALRTCSLRPRGRSRRCS